MAAMRATDIVRHRRERSRRANRRGDRLLRAAALVILLGLLALVFAPLAGMAVGAAGLLALARDLPDAMALAQLPDRFQPATTPTRLYAWDAPDADGLRRPVLIDEIADPRQDGAGWLPFEAIPPIVVAAHLATTDTQFLADKLPPLAADLVAWWRTGSPPTTSSPITDALILTHLRDGLPALPGDTQRAFQDWLLGRQIEERYTREQQLAWVLNTAYYGHFAYGIEAAAHVYFGKGAAALDTAEAALLAAVAQNSATNPFDDPDAARRGQAAVLAAMVATGSITAVEANAALQTPPNLAPPPGSDSAAPDFARLARRQLEAILGPERVLAGGLQVETTIDLLLQSQVECVLAIRAGKTDGSGGGPPCPALAGLPNATEDTGGSAAAAVVALEPATGAISALIGNAGETRPLGTLIQPLIYLTALSQGHSAATLAMDVPSIYLQDGRPYSPRNTDGQFLGPMRLREALAAGRLVPATEVLSWVGVDRVLATARELGLRPGTVEFTADLTFAAGGFPASLLDVSRAFAAISHNGVMAGVDRGDGLPYPATIRRVVDPLGEDVYTYEPVLRETLPAELAYLLTDMLADRDAGCPAASCDEMPALPDGRQAAIAGGESSRGDGWSVGYTPERLIGVVSATTDAAPVQQALLTWAMDEAGAPGWSRPDGLRTVDICEISGLLPARDGRCPIITEWFIPGTEPAETDTMVREMAVNRETGRLATYFTPPQLVERRIYIDYPPAAAAWAEDAGFEPPPTEYDTIRRIPTRSGAAELDIEPWSVVRGPWSIVGSAGGENYAYHRLAYFPGLLPEAMQTLVARVESPIQSDELGVWDTFLIDDGLYTLLLTVVRQDGTFDEVAVPVMVANHD